MIWNEKYEKADPEAMAQLQLERLQATLNRAIRNVEFYRQGLSGRGARGDDVRALSDLAGLPFTTKDDFRKSYPYGMFAFPRATLCASSPPPAPWEARSWWATRGMTYGGGRNALRAFFPPAA